MKNYLQHVLEHSKSCKQLVFLILLKKEGGFNNSEVIFPK